MIEAQQLGQPASINLVTLVALFHRGILSRIAHHDPGDMGFEQVVQPGGPSSFFKGDVQVSAQPGTHNEDGETWRQLSVIFTPGIPTHSARQTFYFNDEGLLQRLDYATDVAGGVASNYCFDHVTFDGIVVPTLRRVVKRKPEGPIVHGPTAVLIVISDVSLN